MTALGVESLGAHLLGAVDAFAFRAATTDRPSVTSFKETA